jgi:hypothetical protein
MSVEADVMALAVTRLQERPSHYLGGDSVSDTTVKLKSFIIRYITIYTKGYCRYCFPVGGHDITFWKMVLLIVTL